MDIKIDRTGVPVKSVGVNLGTVKRVEELKPWSCEEI
jgi:hypothetical protein